MDNSKRIKKIRTLFVVNIVLAVILFISSIILCFMPNIRMAESSDKISSTGISAADVLLGNWEAEITKNGVPTGNTVNLRTMFPDGRFASALDTQDLILIVIVVGVVFLFLVLLIFLLKLLVFYSTSKRKMDEGTLDIRAHFLKKAFTFPVNVINDTSMYLILVFIAPKIIQLLMKGGNIYIPGYVLYVSIILFVVLVACPAIIIQMAKNEVDHLSDEEMSDILPNFANYIETLAIKKKIEDRKENEGSLLLRKNRIHQEDNSEKIKKYYELYQQGIITEEEFNEKKKDILDSDK